MAIQMSQTINVVSEQQEYERHHQQHQQHQHQHQQIKNNTEIDYQNKNEKDNNQWKVSVEFLKKLYKQNRGYIKKQHVILFVTLCIVISVQFQNLVRADQYSSISSNSNYDLVAATATARDDNNDEKTTTSTSRTTNLDVLSINTQHNEEEEEEEVVEEENTDADADVETSTSHELSSISSEKNIQELFYKYHKERILELVNASSAIIWNTRADNGLAFKPLYDHLDNFYLPNKEERINPKFNTSHYIFWGDLCDTAKTIKKYRQVHGKDYPVVPYVQFFRMNENWGGFSQEIPGKTTNWVRDLIHSWKRAKCSKQMIYEYLDHPDTLAVFTMQFQELYHPKVHSLPLGIFNKYKLNTLLKMVQSFNPSSMNKTQLLMINNKRRPMRNNATDAVIRNFNGKIYNTYGKDKIAFENYWKEMKRSKFIMSPGGLGLDCYRHWEAIIMGTIPVLEHLNRKDAWFETLADLPVAWVDYYENLTPEHLEKEYERIISKATSYKYEKLTKWWWINYIKSFVPAEETSKIDK